MKGDRVQQPSAQATPQTLVASVERLEQTAERMSEGSVEIEIRKISQDLKRQDIERRNSRASSVRYDNDISQLSTRQSSGSSHSKSVVDTNSIARRSGFSPTAFVSSPAPAIKSSLSEPYRHRRSSIDALFQSHPPSFPPILTAPAPQFQTLLDMATDSAGHSQRDGSVSITGANKNALVAARFTNSEDRNSPSAGSLRRNGSGVSRSTLSKVRCMFRDFDGIHYAPLSKEAAEGYVPDVDEVDEEAVDFVPHEEDEYYGDEKGRRQTLGSDYHAIEQDDKTGEPIEIMPAVQNRILDPPPHENMVYYPAPVPVSLNMPKRLSQMPSAAINASRKSEFLGSLSLEARRSAMWLAGNKSQDSLTTNEETFTSSAARHGKSQMGMAKLPPQLRASVFFDQDSVPHSIQIKDGSAVATLDSLLDASAHAPKDHSLRDLVNAKILNSASQRPRSSTLSTSLDMRTETGKSRMSLLPLKKFSTDVIQQVRRRKITDFTGYDEAGTEVTEPPDVDYEKDTISTEDESEDNYSRANEQTRYGDHYDEYNRNTPTTLLAELQFRKAQLKSRTRTAAIAFPNGMHATLLELDAVEQIEKKRRQGKHTTLAWEDTSIRGPVHEDDDDNVPLGVLYPSKTGLIARSAGADWDHPLGLIEKRHIEDNEPLSKRRNRLLGMNPGQTFLAQQSRMFRRVDDEERLEHEGETLTQRTRRLKTSKVLNNAIDDGKSDFAGEAMSQFEGLGADDGAKSKKHDSTTTALDANSAEEETLGQRRRRLQAQKASRIDQESQPTPQRSFPTNGSKAEPPQAHLNPQLAGRMTSSSCTPQIYADGVSSRPPTMPTMNSYESYTSGIAIQDIAADHPGMGYFSQMSRNKTSFQQQPQLPTFGIQQMPDNGPRHMTYAQMLIMNPKQRENIDRWRQSVLH